MIENVVGTYPLPMAIATNFKINGKEFLIPMGTYAREPLRVRYLDCPAVIEEASVVAAASNSAKLARAAGGFTGT